MHINRISVLYVSSIVSPVFNANMNVSLQTRISQERNLGFREIYSPISIYIREIVPPSSVGHGYFE